MKRKTEPYRRFAEQRASAKQRGIDWRLTFDQWWAIWEESGKYAQRGRGHGKYVMSRYFDQGPYEPGNVKVVRSDTNGHMVRWRNNYRKVPLPQHERTRVPVEPSLSLLDPEKILEIIEEGIDS